MAKKTAATKAAAKKASDKTEQQRTQLKTWVSGLDKKELKKLSAVKRIVDDKATCERVPKPIKTEPKEGAEGFWTVTFK
jgi:CCR4-NOT transcriptional regulation complex NOT5 subunit